MDTPLRTVGAYEAKTHLPRLLDAARHGERIVITKNGRPVAMLVPLEGRGGSDIDDVIRLLGAMRAGVTLAGRLRAMVESGRR